MADSAPDFTTATWFKSTFSGGGNGNCVEVAFGDGHVGMRDSKQRGAGPVLIFTAPEWASFLDELRSSGSG